MWPNILGLIKEGADSKGLSGVNPKYLSTAKLSGISFEISSFRNRHSSYQIYKVITVFITCIHFWVMSVDSCQLQVVNTGKTR